MRIYSHQVSKDKDDCILQHMDDNLENILLIAISTLKRRMKMISLHRAYVSRNVMKYQN